MPYSSPLANVGFDDPLVAQLWCRRLAEWFRCRGIAWSGTATELASELSASLTRTDQANPCVGSTEILRLLEFNIGALQELGIDATVLWAAGRVRRISLRRNALAPTAPIDPFSSPSPQTDTAAGTLTCEHTDATPGEPQVASGFIHTPTEEVEINQNRGAIDDLQAFDSAASDRGRFLPVGIAILIASAAVASLMIYSAHTISLAGTRVSQRSEERSSEGVASQTPNNSQKASSAAANADDLQELRRQAEQNRIPDAQHELGIRYLEGRGVNADRVRAYAWLVVAFANGERQSEPVLRDLTKQLTVVDLQNVRILMGDWYRQGYGVTSDAIEAHKWYQLAELAGSDEGAIRRRKLERRMTPAQIDQANAITTAWLSRH